MPCEFCGQNKVLLLFGHVCPQGCTTATSVPAAAIEPAVTDDAEPVDGGNPYRYILDDHDDGDVDAPVVDLPTPIGHGPLMPGLRLSEWLAESLYSTFELAAETCGTLHELFTYTYGMAVPGSVRLAHRHHTNLPLPGTLPLDWEFAIQSCHAEVSFDHPAVRAWAFSSSATFVVNDRLMFTQPLSQLLHETPFVLGDLPAEPAIRDVVSMLAHRRGFLLPLYIQLRKQAGYRMIIESDPKSLPALVTALQGQERPLMVRVHLNGLSKKPRY